MKTFQSIISGIAALFLTAATLQAQAFDHSHADLTSILKKHMRGEVVDYAVIQRNPADLEAYLGKLAAVRKPELDKWTREQQMAYLINLYNAPKATTLPLVTSSHRNTPGALIVMTLLPGEGKNKTRLIPALGPSGATAFHDRLARHTIGRAPSFTLLHPKTRLQIHLDGGTPAQGRAWLGNVPCHPQATGDLGRRMSSAIDQAFASGAKRVVVIGTDCPSINENIPGKAYQTLDSADLVYAPASDGGYVLVGLSLPIPEVFRNIEWGGPQVLDLSLAAARATGCRTFLMNTLDDVDLPDDLPHANQALMQGDSLSVIIPTLHEEASLTGLLDHLKQAGPHEIIVADGGSNDRTVEIATQAGVRVISAPKGRATQMNAAATTATGGFLLFFLHADTRPPGNYPQIISGILQQPGTAAGGFRFALGGNLRSAPLIESLVNLRCRVFSTPCGDQGLFLRRKIHNHLEGFPEWPVLEDLNIIESLKSLDRVRIAAESATTSPRRWASGGTIRTFLRHQLMLTAYFAGFPPEKIAKPRP